MPESASPLQHIHQQARVYKLVWEEFIILIGEEGSPFYCSGRNVNLIVQCQQHAACDLCLRSAIEGIDSEFSVLAQAGLDGPRLSSGIVKTTVMGFICVMTVRVTVPADCTTLPGSTSRKPPFHRLGR